MSWNSVRHSPWIPGTKVEFVPKDETAHRIGRVVMVTGIEDVAIVAIVEGNRIWLLKDIDSWLE